MTLEQTTLKSDGEAPTRGTLARLWAHISRRRRIQLIALFVIMIVASIFEIFSIGMVIPFLGILAEPAAVFDHPFVRPIATALKIENSVQLLLPITILFCSAVLAAAVARLTVLWLQTHLSMRILTEMSVETYRRTLYQPYSVHIGRNSSEVIAGIVNKVGAGVGATIGPLLLVTSSAVFTVMVLAALLAISPVTALALFGIIGAIYATISFLTRKQLAQDSVRISRASNEVVKLLQEGLGGIRDVLLDGTQATYAQAYRSADVHLRDAQARIQVLSTAPKFAIEALGIVVLASLAYVLSSQHGGVASAIPVLGAIAVGAQRLLPVLQQAYSSWALIQGARGSLVDVLDLLDQPYGDPDASPPHSAMLPFQQHIRLEGVSFRYGEQLVDVLRDVSLTVPKGARVGFVGETGSGKSTLIDIVMGLLEPTAGRVVIDGTPLAPGNTRSWQRRIAHVPQSIFLSDTTVLENIAFGLPRDQIDRARVKTAARQARISEVIESLSLGYETPIGERGVKLSGGQRQRLGIARALYKEADVIVFDEATSALDTETEQAVMDAISGLGDDLTILMIAHRVTTLRYCSQVVELHQGAVRRVGTYAEIIENARGSGV